MNIVDCGLRNADSIADSIADLNAVGVFVRNPQSAIRNPHYDDRRMSSVVLIPLEDDGRVVIVRQYRAPLDREIWASRCLNLPFNRY